MKQCQALNKLFKALIKQSQALLKWHKAQIWKNTINMLL